MEYVDNKQTGVTPRTGGMPVFLFALILLLGVDVATRYICFAGGCGTGSFIGLSFVAFRNYDFAFSIHLPIYVIYATYGIVSYVLIRHMARSWTENGFAVNFAWSLVCIGALANIFDRLYFGYVRDFIKFGNGYFNLGDVWIVLGVAFICWRSLRES